MKKELHSYSVVILGDTYIIASDELEEHVAEAANYVHIMMQEYTTKAPHLPLKTIAVLTALKLASSTLKKEQQLHVQEAKQSSLLTLVEGHIKRGTLQE